MNIFFHLAMRNLLIHKTKTLILSSFIILGVVIVIMVNSFLNSLANNLEKDFRANVTGDIVFSPLAEKGTTIDIFGVYATNPAIQNLQIPALTDVNILQQLLKDNPHIKNITKLISSKVLFSPNKEVDIDLLLDNDKLSLEELPVANLFAGEKETYWATFPNLKILEGTVPMNNTDILIDRRVKKNYEKLYKESLKVGDSILLLGDTSKGILREGKICGIFSLADEDSGLMQLIYCMPEMARSFLGFTCDTTFTQNLSNAYDLNISSLSDELIFTEEFEDDIIINAEKIPDYTKILGNNNINKFSGQIKNENWNFLLAKVDNAKKVKPIIKELQNNLNALGIKNSQIMTWKEASVSYSKSVDNILIILNFLFTILSIVVFIIIMNTMAVSVIERTREIATMKSLGADKGFIRKIFFVETSIVTLLSTTVGLLLSVFIMLIINSFNVSITNEIAKIILGNGKLHFTLNIKSFITIVLIIFSGTYLCTLYPVMLALKILPVKAFREWSE